MKTVQVLVVGASGFCGKGTLHQLSYQPHYKVIAHLRPESSQVETMTDLCKELKHSLLTASFEQLALEIQRNPPDVICSFIGTTKKKMKPLGLNYEDVDVHLNQILIESAVRLTKKPLFIYVSSMGVEWARWSSYLQARVAVESMLKDSGLPHIILRPGILHGPTRSENRPLEEIGAAISKTMGHIAHQLGFQTKSDEWMPLSAANIGAIVYDGISKWIQNPESIAEIMLVHEIHAKLRLLRVQT